MVQRLPDARTIRASHDDASTLHSYITLQAVEMQHVVENFFSFQHLTNQLPNAPEGDQTLEQVTLRRGVIALREITILKLVKMFHHTAGSLSFDAIIKEYQKGSVDKTLVKEMGKKVTEFKNRWPWLKTYRHNVVAHNNRKRKATRVHVVDLKNETICDAIKIMDLFADGDIAYDFRGVNLREYFGCT